MIYLENKNVYARLNQDVDTSFFTLEMTWAGLRDKRVKEQLGYSVPFTWEEINNGTTINTYIVATEFKPFVEECANALLTKPDLLAECKNETFKLMKKIQFYAKELYPKMNNLNQLSNDELIDKFKISQIYLYQCTGFTQNKKSNRTSLSRN